MPELIPLTLLVMYLAPFLVAAVRNHDMLIPILVLNILFGWTVVGWFVTFAIAARAPSGNDYVPRYK
jgi:hypothetical protein